MSFRTFPPSASLGTFVLALAATVGCSKGTAPAPGASAKGKPSPAATTKTYPLTGVVREVRPESGGVTIRHDEIPGFMKAMTMPFTVADRASLDDVRPGDEVKATLKVVSEGGTVKDYELSGLEVTRPAPAPKMTLDLSGGAARLKLAPSRLEVGEEVPDFAMTTQDGGTLRLSDLRGKVVVLTFIYTKCPLPDFCPMMDRKFAELADRVAAVKGRAGRVRLLSVSFDPEHDTPEVLRKHAANVGAEPPLWTFAVASHAELAKAGPALGLVYGPGADEIVHNLTTAVVDPSGRLARLDVGSASRGWKTADLLKVIADLLAGDAPGGPDGRGGGR